MTRIMYATGVVPMAARNAVVGLIEVADGRSRSALLYGYNSGLERVFAIRGHTHGHRDGVAHHGRAWQPINLRPTGRAVDT